MPLWPEQPPTIQESRFVSNIPHWFETSAIPALRTTGAWTAANRIVYTAVVVEAPIRLASVMIWNGAAVSGLYIAGVYADAGGQPGARLHQAGPAIQLAVSVFQLPASDLDPIGTLLAPGTYWIAIIFDNTTAEVTRLAALTANTLGLIASIFYEDAAAFELPAVATPVPANIALNVPIAILYNL